MENSSSLNPNNSSLVQILLDLHSVTSLNNDIETLELCEKLLAKLDNRFSLQDQVDQKFNAHKYNDQKLKYSKLENFKSLKFINNLSANSVKILFLIIQTVSQDNLIEIKIDTFMDVLKMSKPTVTKCLSELVESGSVSKIENRNKAHGTIYMLNPKIASVGKHTHNKIYEKVAQESALAKFEELNNNHYSITHSKGIVPINKDENKYMTYNSLEKIYDEDLPEWAQS